MPDVSFFIRDTLDLLSTQKFQKPQEATYSLAIGENRLEVDPAIFIRDRGSPLRAIVRSMGTSSRTTHGRSSGAVSAAIDGWRRI